VGLDPKTCQTIYAGVNYVFAPAPPLGNEVFLQFQSALAKHGLSFDRAKRADGEWTLTRDKPPLNLLAKIPEPRVPIGQVMVTSEWLEHGLDALTDETSTVYDAVFEVWPGAKQVVSRDATVRQLYDAGGMPAFTYLWERRLGQQGGQLAFLGRPVSGGGLRLVLPPDPSAADPVQGEVKIESFLRDPRKLFVEVTLAWPKPEPPTDRFEPRQLLREVESFATSDVREFLMLKGE
jgi:hypothetical protein